MITLVPAFYTALIVCLNVIAAGGGSNLYPPEQFIDFTDEDIQERIKGSKIVIISEQVSAAQPPITFLANHAFRQC
jgi:hypothetical protein